jgi:hypothetical protein
MQIIGIVKDVFSVYGLAGCDDRYQRRTVINGLDGIFDGLILPV